MAESRRPRAASLDAVAPGIGELFLRWMLGPWITTCIGRVDRECANIMAVVVLTSGGKDLQAPRGKLALLFSSTIGAADTAAEVLIRWRGGARQGPDMSTTSYGMLERRRDTQFDRIFRSRRYANGDKQSSGDNAQTTDTDKPGKYEMGGEQLCHG